MSSYINFKKTAGEVRGVPDGTGPHGRGMGPGKGQGCGNIEERIRMLMLRESIPYSKAKQKVEQQNSDKVE